MNSQFPPNPETNQLNVDPQNVNLQNPVPNQQQVPFPNIEEMKAIARENAIREVIEEKQQQQLLQNQQQEIVYVKRNLTIAEIIVMFAITTGIVLGVQGIWKFSHDFLPRIEIKINQ
ncbi:MAG: hypothetical protein CMB76_02920 [Euryarchaeota archaeon]|nr:hypothetical protein [Euryarchaeota archaeon]|tara:strand:+ start:594 stop:944 length:351 start_codon:yes stop_codon:yes gene_type:complete